MNPRSLAASLIATVTLIAVAGIVASTGERSVDAQMMMEDGSTIGKGNMTSGTINLEQTTFEAINSRVNTSLIQAMSIAEKSVANDSFALAAFGNDQNGYFVYHIILGTPGMEFYNVMVDPGNGQILTTQQTSKNELEKMHLEHSSEVVRGDHGSSAGGFPLLIPH